MCQRNRDVIILWRYCERSEAPMRKFNLPAFKGRHRAAFALAAVGLLGPVFGWAQDSHNRELPLVWVLSTGGTIVRRNTVHLSIRMQS